MRRATVLGVLVAAGALSVTVAALQQPPAGQQAPMVVEVEKVKDNLYVMKGGGGNSSVFITANGVVVVDTKNPGWGQPLLDAIRKVTNKPVTIEKGTRVAQGIFVKFTKAKWQEVNKMRSMLHGLLGPTRA